MNKIFKLIILSGYILTFVLFTCIIFSIAHNYQKLQLQKKNFLIQQKQQRKRNEHQLIPYNEKQQALKNNLLAVKTTNIEKEKEIKTLENQLKELQKKLDIIKIKKANDIKKMIAQRNKLFKEDNAILTDLKKIKLFNQK